MATQAQKWRTPPAVHGVDICEPSHSHSTGWNNHEQRVVKGVLKRSTTQIKRQEIKYFTTLHRQNQKKNCQPNITSQQQLKNGTK